MDSDSYLQINNKSVRVIPLHGPYRYLGVRLTPLGKFDSYQESELEKRIIHLLSSKLTPQQMLIANKDQLALGMFHSLVLSDITVAKLKRLDLMLSEAVRNVILFFMMFLIRSCTLE